MPAIDYMQQIILGDKFLLEDEVVSKRGNVGAFFNIA